MPSPSPSPAGIAAEDLVALRLYLTRDHARIDQALRALDMSALEALNAHIRLATYGLSLLPDQRGTVWLAADLPAEALAHFVPGGVVREHGFVCATADMALRLGGNTTFAVQSVNGRLVRALAAKPAELTVMFFTGTRFEVLGLDQTAPSRTVGHTTVYLREMPDRRLLKSPWSAPGDPTADDAAALATLRQAARARAGLPSSALTEAHDASLYRRTLGLDGSARPFPALQEP